MKKRSEIESTIIKYFLVIVIFAVAIIFGMQITKQLSAKKCAVSYSIFIKDLVETSGKVGSGETITKSFDMPCDADKVIFVDSTINEPIQTLDEYPIINDALSVKKTNVFIFSDMSLKKSLRMDNLRLNFPYYDCIKSDEGKLHLIFKSEGDRVTLESTNDLSGCISEQPLNIKLSEEDLNKIIDEITKEFSEINMSNLINLSECNITSSFVEGSNETTVSISYNGCKKLTFYQRIPKCAIESMRDAITNHVLEFEPNIEYTILKDDPLVMWDFEPTKKEYSYIIKKLIEDSCKREFIALAANKTVIEPSLLTEEINKIRSSSIRSSLNNIFNRIGTCQRCQQKLDVLVKFIKKFESEDKESHKKKVNESINSLEEKLDKEGLLTAVQTDIDNLKSIFS